MDTFMDKLAQKFTAQEMIKANAAAEAAELQRTRDQVKQYDDCLQEMKQVNEDTKAALVQMQKTLNAGLEQFRKAEIPTDGLNELVEVSLNRIQEIQNNTEEIQAGLNQYLENKSGEMMDYVHKECVKVYRNVQAVVVEEMNKQNEEMNAKLEAVAGKQRTLMGFTVAGMIFALLSAAVLTAQLLIQLQII